MLPGLGKDQRLKSVKFNVTCTVFAILLWLVGMVPASAILAGLVFDTIITVFLEKQE